jgi:hypothetical protein
MKKGRGAPIGDYSSQPVCNLTVGVIDRYIKEQMKCKGYVRYCDDAVGLTKTKAEAHRQIKEYIRLSEEIGLTVKADFTVSKIAQNEKKKRRKRQRGGKRKADRLPRLPIL